MDMYVAVIFLSKNNISTAPDTLDLFGHYQMDEFADYPAPVMGFNPITRMDIRGITKVICYNQTIYDDDRFEGDEFFSLTLTVQGESVMTTQVDLDLNSAIITIVDIEDSEYFNIH